MRKLGFWLIVGAAVVLVSYIGERVTRPDFNGEATEFYADTCVHAADKAGVPRSESIPKCAEWGRERMLDEMARARGKGF